MFSSLNKLLKKWLNRFPAPDEAVNVAANIRDPWLAAKAAALPPSARVLDAGAGQCQYSPLFAHCAYKTQDFAQYTGTAAGSQSETWNYGRIDYVSDITAIPMPDASFDVVLCTEVLEHLPRPIEALKELSRVLAPGGKLLITAPMACGQHQQPYHYYGGFTPNFYKHFLAESGLEVTEMLPIGGLMKHAGQEIHRAGRLLEERTPDNFSALEKYLLMCWLPKYLMRKDKEVFVEEFTVGYLVEAVKKVPGK